MKKSSHKKLSLQRETLAPLQAEQLQGVQGGLTPAIVVGGVVAVTLFFCFPQQAR